MYLGSNRNQAKLKAKKTVATGEIKTRISEFTLFLGTLWDLYMRKTLGIFILSTHLNFISLLDRGLY